MIPPQSRNSLKSRNTEPQTAESAYQYALRILTGRDYSVAKIREKFFARNISESDLEAALLRLQREGWLDDRRYAERFAESALANNRYYGQRLRQEMRRRGLDAALVDEVLERLNECLDEGSEIKVVLDRRYPDFSFSAATDRDKRKVIGYLQRRGFGLSAIIKTLKLHNLN